MPGVSSTTKALAVRVVNDHAAALELLAARRGVDRSFLIREAIETHLGSAIAELLASESRKKSPATQ